MKEENSSYRLASTHPVAQKVALKADWALEDGEFAEATALYEQALSLDPSFDYARFGLARSLTDQEQPKRAKELIEELIERHPDEVDLLHEYGLILLDLKEYDKAQEQWEAVLKIEPHFSSVFANLGQMWNALGKPHKAIEAYEQFLTLSDDQEACEEIEDTVEGIKRKIRREERRAARKKAKAEAKEEEAEDEAEAEGQEKSK